MSGHTPLTAKGKNGTVTFDGQFIAITREGFFGRVQIGRGEKRIPVAGISAVQLKPAAGPIAGFIQFTLAGGVERRSRFGHQTQDAARDENSVTFWSGQSAAFTALRDAIVAVQRQPQGGIPQQQDIGGQLAQLAHLRASGALTDGEYAAAKARVIG